MYYDVEFVPISSIDTGDSTFRITTGKNLQVISRSIRSVGLLNPPMVAPAGSKYRIIFGFKRIEACREIGLEEIPVRMCRSGMSELDYAKSAILDNSGQRELNLVEVARSVRLLYGFADTRNPLPDLVDGLGLPFSNALILDQILKINHMTAAMQEGIISGRISLPMALELTELEGDSGDIVSEIFQSLNLSLNKQREILALVKEIALREDKTLPEVLNGRDVVDMLFHGDWDKGQRTRELRKLLRKKRYPEISRFECVFEGYLKSLRLSGGAGLIPPRDFEGNTYTLQFPFRNMRELENCRAVLEKILRHPETKSILE